MFTGRLYRTVLCRCYDKRRQGDGVVGAAAADNQLQHPHQAGMASPTDPGALLASVDEEDDVEDAAEHATISLPRLRFEITFHRPCPRSQRRRQRRRNSGELERETTTLEGRRRRTAKQTWKRGQTIELETNPQRVTVDTEDGRDTGDARPTQTAEPGQRFWPRDLNTVTCIADPR